jgi:hypothetical protein
MWYGFFDEDEQRTLLFPASKYPPALPHKR